jgi:hypothetical protein
MGNVVKSLPVPSSFTNDQQRYLRDSFETTNNAIKSTISRETPTDQVLLVSPSKKVFAVTVSDAGVLSAVLVQE